MSKGKKIVVVDSETRQIIADFDTWEEALAYADKHDLACAIDLRERHERGSDAPGPAEEGPAIHRDKPAWREGVKVVLMDSETKQPIKEFATMDEAVAYADDHDLKCYIDLKEHMPALKN